MLRIAAAPGSSCCCSCTCAQVVPTWLAVCVLEVCDLFEQDTLRLLVCVLTNSGTIIYEWGSPESHGKPRLGISNALQARRDSTSCREHARMCMLVQPATWLITPCMLATICIYIYTRVYIYIYSPACKTRASLHRARYLNILCPVPFV